MSTTLPRQRSRPGQDRPAIHTPVSHAAFVAGGLVILVVAIVLAIVVKTHPQPLPGDVGTELGLQRLLLPHKWLTNVMDEVSAINWPIPSAIAMGVVTLLLLALRRWLDAGVALLVGALADGSSYLTNEIVRRPRPAGHGIHILRNITNYFSFPSGHVVHALAFYGFLLFLTFRVRRSYPWLWIVRIALLLVIVLMGPSRILEGEHWPTDVLEGLFYGAFWLIAGVYLYSWAIQRWPRASRQ